MKNKNNFYNFEDKFDVLWCSKNHPSTNPWQERFAIKQMIENKERKRRSQMTN